MAHVLTRAASDAMIRRMHGGKANLQPDVLVVGGGFAGLAAAVATAQTGASTLLLDDQERRLNDGEPPQDTSVPLVEGIRAAASAGAVLRLDTSVWGCFAGPIVAGTDLSHTFTLRPRRLILATGAHDAPLYFPGSSLPGVISGRRLRKELLLGADVREHRYAVIGPPEEVESVANAIMRASGEIVARATGRECLRAEGTAYVDALWIDGDRIPCDTIVLAGRQAASELARMVGCRVTYRPSGGGFIPELDSHRQATSAGIFVAGDAAGPCGAEVAIAEGRLAGIAAAASLGVASESDADSARDVLDSLAPDRSVPPAAHRNVVFRDDDAAIICPCEKVDFATIRAAIQHGARSINDVKRRTRAGMGPCQGVGCMAPIAHLLHVDGNVAYDAIEPMTSRPPARPISLGQLAALDQGARQGSPHQAEELS